MTPYADRIIVREAGPCTVHVLPTATADVVSLRLSVDAFPDFGAGEERLQEMAVALLDKGTTVRDRFALAAELEERGATVRFAGAGTRVRCSARLLTGDEARIGALIGEMLSRPAFEPDEFGKARQRAIGAVRHAMTDTGHRAAAALSGHLYRTTHPNHIASPEDDLAALDAMRPDAVRAFHERRFLGRVRCVAVGDVDPDALAGGLEEGFESWSGRAGERPEYPEADRSGGGMETVEMPDRPNLDVRFGHTVSLRRNDPDYDALHLGVFALGGNFSARLMSRIRDDLGLTYGIGSSLSGVHVHHGGAWNTSVTLSADRLERGLDETRRELARFVSGGVTPEEVAEKQETLAGRFVVALASTGGLAQGLLSALENGFGPDYLDTYAERVGSLTAPAVNEAVRRHLDPSRLFVAVAGSSGAHPAPAG